MPSTRLPCPCVSVLQGGHRCGPRGAGQGTGTPTPPRLGGGCRRRRRCAVVASLPKKGFIAGFGFGKQLTQQVLGREPEACRHLGISQLGAVWCHRPATGTAAGTGLWAQPEDRLSLGSPSRGRGHLPTQPPGLVSPGDISGEGFILHRLGLGPLQPHHPLTAPGWALPVPKGESGRPGAGREAPGAGSCLPVLPARHAPSASCSPWPGRSVRYR